MDDEMMVESLVMHTHVANMCRVCTLDTSAYLHALSL